jgi:anti-sigma B factor antagonist
VRTIDIRLQSEKKGDWSVLHVGGEVDLFTAPKVKEQILDLLNAGTTNLVVDLEQVTFMDSTGIGVLIGALRRLREREGALALVCPQGPVLRVLEVTGLHKVFDIFDSVDKAIA